ncbi:hypothetical protein DSM19430T_28480 [Desulfovibrio psychrotolerans]|uniref:Uncharacterized protein n=1 Tax=Desulfovibrio psychrotolerans TaxID=415242 RepID=A0A7J0BYV8_9BACT|nr:hypothetical protein DSM19430T_28480 [Desulfovibrio psychrotolerans]
MPVQMQGQARCAGRWGARGSVMNMAVPARQSRQKAAWATEPQEAGLSNGGCGGLLSRVVRFC